MRNLQAWEYKGVLVEPADRNDSGIRWTARTDDGRRLRSDTKQEMKHLINNRS